MRTRSLITFLSIASAGAGCASNSGKPSVPSGQYVTEQAKLSGSTFHKVFLDGARFDDVNLSDATFNNINLSGARYTNIKLSGAAFDDIDLSGAEFDHVDFSRVNIRNANLKDMKIDGVLVSDLVEAYRQAASKPTLPLR